MKKENKKNTEILKATYGSDKTPLKLGDTEVPCYVLENGTRVLSGRAIQKALGYEGTSGSWLRTFITSKRISENIEKKLLTGFLEPIQFLRIDAGGSQPITYGYEATTFIDFCDALITLKQTGVLTENQLVYAQQAEMIIRSVAKVGIIALVDEVTGYQNAREKDALQSFLAKFINEERGIYIKTYPNEFFESIFKMKGWSWKLANQGRKPQVVGHYINNYVYSRIAPKVLDELKKVNPKNEKGNRKGKHTQHIDIDYGHPKLKEHLSILIAFAKAAGFNWNSWDRMVKRALPKFNEDGSAAQEIDFPEE